MLVLLVVLVFWLVVELNNCEVEQFDVNNDDLFVDDNRDVGEVDADGKDDEEFVTDAAMLLVRFGVGGFVHELFVLFDGDTEVDDAVDNDEDVDVDLTLVRILLLVT